MIAHISDYSYTTQPGSVRQAHASDRGLVTSRPGAGQLESSRHRAALGFRDRRVAVFGPHACHGSASSPCRWASGGRGSCAFSQRIGQVRVSKDDAEAMATIGIGCDSRPSRLHGVDELSKCEAMVDIVNQQGASRPEHVPGALELKARVAACMETVVDEEIDLAELGEQTR